MLIVVSRRRRHVNITFSAVELLINFEGVDNIRAGVSFKSSVKANCSYSFCIQLFIVTVNVGNAVFAKKFAVLGTKTFAFSCKPVTFI